MITSHDYVEGLLLFLLDLPKQGKLEIQGTCIVMYTAIISFYGSQDFCGRKSEVTENNKGYLDCAFHLYIKKYILKVCTFASRRGKSRGASLYN